MNSHIKKFQMMIKIHLLGINVVQMILYELHSSSEIRLVELVWDVPSDWSKLSPLLYSGMKESNSIQNWLPLWQVVDV